MDVDIVFGYGKYLCLGRNVAFMELNKIFVQVSFRELSHSRSWTWDQCVSQLLRNFDFTVVDPMQPWKTHNVGLHIQSDMWMRITERVPRF